MDHPALTVKRIEQYGQEKHCEKEKSSQQRPDYPYHD